MDFLQDLLLFFHFIGLAALFGGLFVQVATHPRVVNNAMWHGILTQLVTGVLLLGVLAIVLFDAVWARVGLVAALILVFGAILAFAWNVDRKDKAKRAGLDELPDV